MQQTVVIDSSVFIASLIKTDIHHDSSRNFFAFLGARLDTLSVAEPATVMLEVANVLVRHGHPKEARALEAYFNSVKTIAIDDLFVVSAIPLLEKVSLKTADALVAITASLANAALVSWDKSLLRETKKIAPAFTPEEYVRKGGVT